MGEREHRPTLDRQELRRIAREAADGRLPQLRQLSPADVEHLIHQLGVYQSELVAQNEELLETRTELERTRDRYRTLFEAAPVGYLTLRPDGAITEVNLPGAELLNTHRAGLVGQNLTSFVVAEQRDEFQKILRETMRQDGVRAAELQLRPAGCEAPLHVHLEGRPVASTNGPSVLMILTDVSAYKHLEAELRQVSAAKSQFLTNMSHEIRTPLGGVLGMADILGRSALSAEQRQCVDGIQRSGKLLLGVINDVLDISRIDSQGMALDTTVFALRALVEDTVHLLAESAQGKGLELCCRVGPEVPKKVLGDPGRVRQVLFNLVGNAIKFTDRGRVVVRAARQEGPGQRPETVVVRLTVEDTGVGVPETAQESLFGDFQQGDPSTTRRFGGSGLGLAITKRIVEAMGGEIGVRSRSGEGSQFWCTLPFEQREAAPKAEPLSADVRALVVQGQALSRSLLREQLQRLGVAVTEAGSRAEGRQAATRAAAIGRPFQLAFVDLELPNGDGLKFAMELQRRENDAAVILLAPFTTQGLQIGSAEAGWTYLLKPIREADLAEKVRAALAPEEESAAAGRRSAPTSSPNSEVRGKVLLAEDNHMNRIIVLELLEILGYDADVVEDGAAAVAAAQAHPYHLVLMDWQMPGMDGLEAAREIRRRETGGRRVPIAALTAHAFEEHREQALAAGMDDFLTKPVDLQALAAVLQRWSNEPSAGLDVRPAAALGAQGGLPHGAGEDRVEERLDELLRQFPPAKV